MTSATQSLTKQLEQAKSEVTSADAGVAEAVAPGATKDDEAAAKFAAVTKQLEGQLERQKEMVSKLRGNLKTMKEEKLTAQHELENIQSQVCLCGCFQLDLWPQICVFVIDIYVCCAHVFASTSLKKSARNKRR